MQLSSDLLQWQKQRSQQPSHRQLLVISGQQAWALDTLNTFIDTTKPDSVLTLGGSTTNSHATNKTYKQALGQEYQYVVYNAFSGVRANALFALSGCVCKSGLMILLCPDLNAWPEYPDPERQLRSSYPSSDSQSTSFFVQWLTQHIANDMYVCVLQNESFHSSLAPIQSHRPLCEDALCRTVDQQHAVERILTDFQQPELQMVISANRGRGKSSALGIAAGHLLATTSSKIVVTATHKSMTDMVFTQASRTYASYENAKQKNQHQLSNLNFIALDILLASSEKIDLILVDEAATVPNQILALLLERSTKIIFSTTVQGYEGSGRGFELRFKPFLQKHYPNYKSLTLEEPIRWHVGDVLEEFWYKVMAMMPERTKTRLTESDGHIEKGSLALHHHYLSASDMVENPQILSEVFSLLVDAHYQTTPDDLVRLLDATDQHVLASFTPKGQLVAVALVNDEGGNALDDVAHDISSGVRRVPGHLSAQKLAFLCANEALATLRYLRIVRIAVNKAYRHQGVGSALINFIEKYAIEYHFDFISTSFGLTAELLRFWQLNNFTTVHVGSKRDAASGEFSGLLLKTIHTEHTKVFEQLCRFGMQEIVFQREQRLTGLSGEIVESVLNKVDWAESTDQIAAAVETFLTQFTRGSRPLYSIERPLNTWLANMKNPELLQSDEYLFLQDLVIRRLPIQSICSLYQLTGKKQIERYARQCVVVLLERQAIL